MDEDQRSCHMESEVCGADAKAKLKKIVFAHGWNVQELDKAGLVLWDHVAAGKLKARFGTWLLHLKNHEVRMLSDAGRSSGS